MFILKWETSAFEKSYNIHYIPKNPRTCFPKRLFKKYQILYIALLSKWVVENNMTKGGIRVKVDFCRI